MSTTTSVAPLAVMDLELHSPAPDAASERGVSPATTTSSGTKRKRETGPKFYSVRTGFQPGIYHSWADCLSQVKGYKNAMFKSFTSLTEAEAFLNNTSSNLSSQSASSATKFYAVRSGRVPGVYTDWPSAQQQIVGWAKPKHKSFASRAEAEAFVRNGEDQRQTELAGKVLPEGGRYLEATADHSKMETMTVNRLAQSEEIVLPAKKQKLTKPPANNIPTMTLEMDENVEPGTGPLPPGAEDGFDPRIILNPETGKIEYKTEARRKGTKLMASGHARDGMLRIYTDGSSLGNGAEGAIAGVGVYFGPADSRNVSEALVGPRQTNQRAELTAVLRALDICPRDRDVTIFSDSNYAINCVTVWFVNWRRNGWMTSARKPVENKDLVESIVSRIEERESLGVKTFFEWLKGHANDPGNIAADQLAVAGAREARAHGLEQHQEPTA